MNDTQLHELDMARLAKGLRRREFSAVELARHALHRIDAHDPGINAFVAVTRERALREAAEADAAFARGEDRGPLQGIPYALKDIMATAGVVTTCGSRLLAGHVPDKDCEIQTRLRTQGGVLIGKTTTYEFASAGPDHSLPDPPARNPWNREHVTGGSSSGSAAAVAAGFVRVALGTDTAGSIRGPAGLCGVVGFKPSFDLISTRGVFPLAPTLDHCGPLAASVGDAAATLAACAEPSPAMRPSGDGEEVLRGLRVGVMRRFMEDPARGVAPETVAGIEDCLARLKEGGSLIRDVSLPDYDLFNAAGRLIMFAEAFSIHERAFRQTPELLGRHLYLRMGVGAFVSAPDLLRAHRLRRHLIAQVDAVWADCDVLVGACAVGPAPRFDALTQDVAPIVPMQSMPFNVTGVPAIAMPSGRLAGGLPLSVQLVAGRGDDARLLRVAAALEARLPRLSLPM